MTDPQAILFDLDDTLISAYGDPRGAWTAIAAEFSDELHPGRDELVDAILAVGVEFWADPVRSRNARLEIARARREIVGEAFGRLGLSRRAVLNEDLVDRLVVRFGQYRDANMRVFDGALDVLEAARARGIRLGLVTNGAGQAQRDKLRRFDLGGRFEHIQIEGEAGFGKPDPRAFLTTLDALRVEPGDAWMVGDNFEADIVVPHRLGLTTHWYNPAAQPAPAPGVVPNRILSRLGDLFAA